MTLTELDKDFLLSVIGILASRLGGVVRITQEDGEAFGASLHEGEFWAAIDPRTETIDIVTEPKAFLLMKEQATRSGLQS